MADRQKKKSKIVGLKKMDETRDKQLLYIIKLADASLAPIVCEALRAHHGHNYLSDCGPAWLNWTTTATADKLLDNLKCKGCIIEWSLKQNSCE